MPFPYDNEPDPDEIEHADPADPPVEGVDYVVDNVMSFDGDSGTMPGSTTTPTTIRRRRP